jgi:sugar phosphate isomerase/epimerase
MKLSFSTRGWSDCGWEDFLSAAKATGFSGIELHGVAHSPGRRMARRFPARTPSAPYGAFLTRA